MADDPVDPSSLDRLEARLRAARRHDDQTEASPAPSGRGLGLGFRIATDMVAAIAVGTLIGFGLDHWLGTKPWLMMVFTVLGSVSGLLNAYRAARDYDKMHSSRGEDEG